MNTPTPRGTVPIDSITDTSRGIYKVTGPCSMSSPCPGESCPEHGSKAPVVTVEPSLWDVIVDGREIGVLTHHGDDSRPWCAGVRQENFRTHWLGYGYPTQADAIAAVLAEHAKPQPETCPECGQPVHR